MRESLVRAGAMTSLFGVPMLAELASNPRLPGIGPATWFADTFLLITYVTLVGLFLAAEPNQRSGTRRVAVAGLVVVFAAFAPNAFEFLLEQLRSALITVHLLPTYRTWVLAALGTLAAACVAGVVLSSSIRRALGHGATKISALLLVILIVQTGAHGLAETWSLTPHQANRPLAQTASHKPAVTRVTWIIFDELDADILDASIDQLPAFRAFRDGAVVGTQVFPPANFTHQSVPRMLVGRELMSAEFNQTRVNLRKDLHSGWVSMAHDPDFLLARLAAEGRAVAVAGWHFPYCTLVPYAVRCVDDQRFEVPGAAISPSEWLWAKNEYVQRAQDRLLEGTARSLQEIQLAGFQQPRLLKVRANARSLALLSHATFNDIDDGADVIYAHWPCPHLPRLDGAVTTGEQALLSAYGSNLKHCDRLLGEVVQHIAHSNLRDSRPMALIVTSDHWLRNRDCIDQHKRHCTALVRRRVPMMVRIYGRPTVQTPNQVSYDRTISNLEIGKLVSGFVNGSIASPQDVVRSLDGFSDHPTLIEPY